jgi:DNA-binding transcriptional LysR family regulator
MLTFAALDGSPEVVKVKGRVRVSASEGMRSAVLEGLGVAVVPTWLFTDEIERGIL